MFRAANEAVQPAFLAGLKAIIMMLLLLTLNGELGFDEVH
jgi:hypothetical protein